MMGWIALSCVVGAIALMTAVALDSSGQVCDLIREMMAVASIVMSLLTPLGLSDGLLFTKVNKTAAEAPISTPISINGPFRTAEGKEVGEIVLVINGK